MAAWLWQRAGQHQQQTLARLELGLVLLGTVYRVDCFLDSVCGFAELRVHRLACAVDFARCGLAVLVLATLSKSTIRHPLAAALAAQKVEIADAVDAG